MRPKVKIVGINEEKEAKILLAKILKAREAERDWLRQKPTSPEKESFVDALATQESKFLAQGISRA